MSRSTNLLMFVFGAAIGSLFTYRYVREKYARIAQEEIDSVKEVFSKREKEVREREEKIDNTECKTIIAKQNYTNYSNSEVIPEDVVQMDVEESEEPEIISPEEVGENENYEIISLTYYHDYVLADENDEIVNVEGTIGEEALGSFGEYEDDSVFVRNDRLKCYYEVLLDLRDYSDVIKKMPKPIQIIPERKPHEVD